MSENERLPDDAVTSREGLVSQLRELEAFVQSYADAGEALPPEATEMVERLREIVRALDALTSSLNEE